MIYNILAWIVFGLIAGFIAKAVMPGPDSNSTVVTILLGIVGAVVGGFIGRALFGGDAGVTSSADGFSLMGLVLAVVGAIVVLAIYRLATGRSLRA
jgi:uncharacterized membrane protein YeaQ/YmgE (transglycosylase-associated protein family)